MNKTGLNRNAKHGQTLVEFALILPLFLLLVMFIFDMGRAVYYYSVLFNAVREGARVAAVGETDYVLLENLVEERAYGINIDWFSIQTNGDLIEVEALYEFEPITPLIMAFVPHGHIHIWAESTMRLEFSP